MSTSTQFDVAIVGAGAAGMFCAGIAGQRGLSVLLLDHAASLGEKIRISGGGRCNFTNRFSGPQHFLSRFPSFVKPALQAFPPESFIGIVRAHGISFHEKHRGQLFCNESAQQIVRMLSAGLQQARVRCLNPVSVLEIGHEGAQWAIQTTAGLFRSSQLVMATGGLPVPAMGASGFALDFARRLNLPVTPIRPALVPLALTAIETSFMASLAGLSLPVRIRAGSAASVYGDAVFDEDLLFTHKGISGPAVLQASSYWTEGEEISIDWLQGNAPSVIFEEKRYGGKSIEAMLSTRLPLRFSRALANTNFPETALRPWAEYGKKHRLKLFSNLSDYRLKPATSLGWKKAEVMLGGVDTQALDPQTMASKAYPSLYFIGECLDVTGHLGGHNFQWAWSSGYACAMALQAGPTS